MEYYRKLSSSEREALITMMKEDINRKILHGFFWLWKGAFILGCLGIISTVIDVIKTGEWLQLIFIPFGLPVMYFGFWWFPNFIVKNIDSKLTAVTNDEAMIRETDLISIRLNRERSSRNSNRHIDVYYATVMSEDKSHTYEIITSAVVANLPQGSPVYILRFSKDDKAMVNNEVVVPLNFASYGNMSIPF